MAQSLRVWPEGRIISTFRNAANEGNLLLFGLAYDGLQQDQLHRNALDPSLRRCLEMQVLCNAGAKDQAAVVQMFLDRGVDINTAYPFSGPYTTVAGRYTSEINVGERSDMVMEVTPLVAHARWGSKPETMLLLLENGAAVTSRAYNALDGAIGSLPWSAEAQIKHRACTVAKTRLLLEYDADPMTKGNRAETLFHQAYKNGHKEMLQLLLNVKPELIRLLSLYGESLLIPWKK